MLHAMLRLFGLDPVQPVKRPPTARKRKPAAPVAKPAHTIAAEHPRALTYEERETARALVTVTSLGAACRVYGRHVGEFGSPPSPQEIAQARRVLGAEGWAYLQALTLSERKSPQIGTELIGDREKEAGLHFRIEEGMEDLDLWEGIASREEAAAKAAKSLGQKPKPPIVIPSRILALIAEREKLRLARLDRTGARGKGGPKLAPGRPAAPETAADPAPVTEVTPTSDPAPASSDRTPADDEPSTPRKP